MNTETLYAVIFILVFSTLAILLWNWKVRNERSSEKREGSSDSSFDSVSTGTDCPLCGEHLPKGNRVHSVLFPGKEFDLMRIYGCRHCWEGHAMADLSRDLHSRRCPSCGETIPEGGYVMAQVYNKPYRKTHVHVYGCTVCKPGRG
ncbi:MAG: hypothetical protein KAH21_03965 [Spirochaetaceae bacterium]|nr:hypothetical protein [Spirochaetaceae bacterium]